MHKTTILVLAILGAVACKEQGGASAGSPPPTGGPAAPATAAVTPAPAAAPSASGSEATAAVTPPPAPAAPPAAKTCAGGDAAACVAEARAVAPTGAYRAKLTPAEADAKEAATVELAARACELDAGEGCALVARYGKFAESDENLERACELGHLPSCGSIGRGLVDKRKDPARAAELLEKACAADAVDWMSQTSHHGGFCYFLHELHTELLKDEAKAARALERACAQGDKRGCPCKTDQDCGEMPDDMSGEFFCSDGACDVSGG